MYSLGKLSSTRRPCSSRIVDAGMFADQQHGLLMSSAVRHSPSGVMCPRLRADAGQPDPRGSLSARVPPQAGVAPQGGLARGTNARVKGAVDAGERQDRLRFFRRGTVVVVEAQLVGARQIDHVRRRVVFLGARMQTLVAVTRPPARPHSMQRRRLVRSPCALVSIRTDYSTRLAAFVARMKLTHVGPG